jgi:hypothetical protein
MTPGQEKGEYDKITQLFVASSVFLLFMILWAQMENAITHLDLVKLFIGARLNLDTLPEPLLLHHMDPRWGAGNVGGVYII